MYVHILLFYNIFSPTHFHIKIFVCVHLAQNLTYRVWPSPFTLFIRIWDFWKIIEGGSRFCCKIGGNAYREGPVYRRGQHCFPVTMNGLCSIIALYSASLSVIYFSFNSFWYVMLLLFHTKSKTVNLYESVEYLKKTWILFCSLLNKKN